MEKKKIIENPLTPAVSQAGLALLIPLLYQLFDPDHHLRNNNKSNLEMRMQIVKRRRAEADDEAKQQEMVDWATGLPPEMICAISRWLPVPDYLRFRAVCSSWASALAAGPILPAAQHFPWLGLRRSSDGKNNPSFLTPAPDNRCYYLSPIPDVYEGEWIGARDGWLVITHSHSKYVWLLNPITGARLDLPSLYTLPVEQSDIRKVVLSPVSGRDVIAVVIYGRQRRVAFARPNHKEWTALPLHSDDTVAVDIVYHGDKFVCLTSRGHLQAFDNLDGPSPYAAPISAVNSAADCDIPLDDVYLVSTPCGDLLKVWEKKVFSGADSITRSYSIMRFNPGGGDSRWIKIDNLGDLSLFLDLYHSVALSAGDVCKLRGNCIYFASAEVSTEAELKGHYVNDVGVFDIKKEVAKSYIPENFREIGRWHRIPPIWFMPSLS